MIGKKMSGCGDSVPVGLGVALGAIVWVTVEVAVGVGDSVCEGVGNSVADGVGVAPPTRSQ